MKKLKELLNGVEVLQNRLDGETEISDVTIKSGRTTKGSLYIAIKGYSEDGNNYINDSIARGAKAIVSEYPQKSECIIVKDARKALAQIASNFYGNPEKKLKIIGVTGTNGKTSTVNIISHILKENRQKVTVIGTLGAYIDGKEYKIDMTTPDPIELSEIFYLSVEAGVKYVVMEVSAHAIYLQKVCNIQFEYGIFTNVSQDHLDFFKDMETYKEVKKSFFRKEQVKTGIINADDETGLDVIMKEEIPIISYGIENPSEVFAIDITEGTNMSFVVNASDDIFYIQSRLKGRFNIYNLLAAITVCKLLKIGERGIIKAIKTLKPIDGRFNVINVGKKVIIDYAHTPDGLENLLKTARNECKGKLIAVFGCGGNRDVKKRRIMGEISGKLADLTIITKDNSRFEEPSIIMKQIEEGVRSETSEYILIEDREMAINYAIAYAKENDTVVIAGKGAEEYMEEKGEKKAYSDFITVESIKKQLNVQ